MKLLRGIARSDAPVDALVLAGDSVNLAEQKEYGFLKSILRLYNKTGCVIPSMGNHDSGSTSMGKDCEKTFETTCGSFRDFQRFFYHIFVRRAGLGAAAKYEVRFFVIFAAGILYVYRSLLTAFYHYCLPMHVYRIIATFGGRLFGIITVFSLQIRRAP